MMQPKSLLPQQVNLVAEYYEWRAEKARSIASNRSRLAAMMNIAHQAARAGVPCPVKATAEALKLLNGIDDKKGRSRPFSDPLVNARIAGQVDVLCQYFRLSQRKASDLIATLHSNNPDKPRDPSGIRRIYGKRDVWWALAKSESCGSLSFRPVGIPDVDQMLFSSKETDRLLRLIRDDQHPVKQIRDFFRQYI